MPDQVESIRPQTLDLPLSPGSSLGGFKIVSRLGQGSMGTVYRAGLAATNGSVAVNGQAPDNGQAPIDGEQVAMKVLLPHLTQDSDRHRRFVSQTQKCLSLSHPNLARILSIDRDNQNVFVTAELFEGSNLAECVANEGPIPPDLVYMIIRQVADGLHHAHQYGVIHGDIKPQNILLTTDGNVKILDLGLSRLRDDFNEGLKPFYIDDQKVGDQPSVRHLDPLLDLLSDDHRLAAIESVLATIAYAAPQQIRDPRNSDEQGDIFSLGCVAFYLLSGNAILCDLPPADVLRSKLSSSDWPNFQLAAAPSTWLPVLHRMLAWNSEDRFDSMLQVIDSLDESFDIDHRFAKTEKAGDEPTPVDSFQNTSSSQVPLSRHFIDQPAPPKSKSLWSAIGSRCRQVFGQR